MSDNVFRRALRPAARGVRRVQTLYRDAAVRTSGRAPAGKVSVSYGHASVPAPDRPAVGGIVKLQSLQQRYPHEPRRFSVLYLVTSNLPNDAVSLARAAREKGARIVVNQNGVAYHAWHGPGWESINAPMIDLLQLADHVFYQSEFCKLSADRFIGQRRGSWEVLYNAVDTQRFVLDPARRDGSHLTLLLGGTQSQFYRVDTALQTLARVIADRPDTRLLITGRLRWAGNEARSRNVAIARAAELGIEDRVEFLGPYAQTDAPRIFQRADLLLHTKYNDPCPAVVIEAMACGLPVVYSKSGGVPELVGDDAGIGLPAELSWERDQLPDPHAMAAAVMTVARQREEMSKAARARATSRFDIRPWLDRHQQVFERLVDRSSDP